MEHKATSQVERASCALKIIRKDGRVEDRGVVAQWFRNPLKRWWWNLKQYLKG